MKKFILFSVCVFGFSLAAMAQSAPADQAPAVKSCCKGKKEGATESKSCHHEGQTGEKKACCKDKETAGEAKACCKGKKEGAKCESKAECKDHHKDAPKSSAGTSKTAPKKSQKAK